MIDYTQFGAQTIDNPDDEEARRRSAQQNPAGPAVAQQPQGVASYTPQSASPQRPLVGQVPASPTGGSTAASPTFRQLQIAGIPRPAPPLIGPGGYQTVGPETPAGGPGGGPGGNLGGDITAILRQLLANPTAYGQEQMQREYEGGARRIDDDYALQQKQLNDEMARRGLYDSSIAAGNLSDLNIGKRSAQTNLMDSLLQKRADAQDSGIRSALSAATNYQGNQDALLAAWYQLFGM